MYVDEEKCLEFGLDPKQVKRIASRISKAALEARAIGLEIFGGGGSGDLRYTNAEKHGPGHSIVSNLDGSFDGGDGGDVY